jgi:SSS family solute:Na+ symporter
VIIGVVLMAIRQFWTIRMGMRGVVISDMFQGIVAYVGGSLLILGLIAWLILSHGLSVMTLSPTHLEAPGLFSTLGPLYFFSIIFSGVVGGWCWPATFIRLYTADSVRSVQRAGAMGAPLSLLFSVTLVILGLLASPLPEVAKTPDLAWFTLCRMAGGPLLLGLGGVVVLAGTMGNVDGNVQACGAQIANDIVGSYFRLDHKRAVLSAQIGMLAITLLSAWLATRTISHLVTLAILSYQGIMQLAVPQYLGIFWKRGNATGSILGTLVGFALAIGLQAAYPDGIAWAWGLTSGVLALVMNAAVYVGCAVLFPHADDERQRVNDLFALTDRQLTKAPVVAAIAV